jgi:hypothetical protein
MPVPPKGQRHAAGWASKTPNASPCIGQLLPDPDVTTAHETALQRNKTHPSSKTRPAKEHSVPRQSPLMRRAQRPVGLTDLDAAQGWMVRRRKPQTDHASIARGRAQPCAATTAIAAGCGVNAHRPNRQIAIARHATQSAPAVL